MATVLESFVSDYLLQKLVAFAEEKVALITGVKDELKTLEGRMRGIGAFLKDAERRRITDESVNNWLNELKDVMYDADDMIDRWRYNNQLLLTEEPTSSSNSPTCCPFLSLSCFHSIPVRHEIAGQVKNLNLKLDQIIRDKSNLNLQQLQSEVREVSGRDARVSSPVITVDVVGNEIEEATQKLVKMATVKNIKKINLVAITGMGGIGKTTTAQRIYNNHAIENRYDTKMWLSITKSYSSAQIVKEAIRQAKGNPGQAERESELLPILATAMSGKSFFLVLDDAWNPDVWVKLLQDPLMANTTQGFILVTTRDQSIALQMGAKHIHQATILSTKSGWELLHKRAYITDAEDIRTLEDVGIEIVKKCGGIPLAIKSIAAMLATKDATKNEWENILRNKAWSISGLPSDINRALYLSYEDLPPQLKQCFLQCSLYPSNDYIRRMNLIRDWMAEGYIEEKGDQIMDVIAEEYYQELIRRHLLELNPYWADHSQCRMHELLRELAKHLSREEIISTDQELPDAITVSRVRHLSILKTNENISIPGPATRLLRLRTFVIYNCLSQLGNHIFERLKHLRVLRINEKGLHTIPDSIGDLIHLRLLDLDRTSISNLPDSVGSLRNLLFLTLWGCEHLHTLPRGITRLCNLRHLDLRGTPTTSVPKGLGRLQKLTEIWGFQVVDNGGHFEDQNGWDLQELEGLSQLRRIQIDKLERGGDVSAVFANKTHLKELNLVFSEVVESSRHVQELGNENSREILENLYPPSCIEDIQIRNYGGKMLPGWMSLSSLEDKLSNLQYLQLIGWSCCTYLPPLGLLPNLKYLRVEGASAIVRINSKFLGIAEWKGPNLPTVFPKLEYLIFKNMPNWEEWELSDFEGEKSPSWQLAPRMQLMVIEKCPKLRALPEGLQQLTTVVEFLVREADSIRSIQYFPFGCEGFEVTNNQCLESLSNLPGVKRIEIISNPNLRQVSKLDSLEHIHLKDYKMEHLPEWLIDLMEERKGRKEDKLRLEMFCTTALSKRCLKDGPDWPIIKCFSSVSVYNEEKTTFLEYTREPESYFYADEGELSMTQYLDDSTV